MGILNKLQVEAAKMKGNSYSFSYSCEELKYKSFLTGFNNKIFSLFNNYYEEINIPHSVQNLFKGKVVNHTENQAALHHIYRDLYSSAPNNFASNDMVESCRLSIEKCIDLKKELINKGIKNVVTIGIGGSFEGPKLLIKALTSEQKRNFKHIFLTGPDIIEFKETVEPLNQKETFFIVSSKSFSTEETLQSLNLSKSWLGFNCMFEDHFVAITSNPDEARNYGFNDNIIEFPSEIGGRYSIWSDISIAAEIENSVELKQKFIEGGKQADLDLNNNNDYLKFVKMLAFSDIWLHNFKKKTSRVILSYIWKFRSFPDYIQQLEMESLGKQPSKESKYKKTGQIIFGGYGPTAQHSYFQLLHQGTHDISADIIASIEDSKNLAYVQAITQSKLLSNGADNFLDEKERINGNIPLNLFLIKSVDPYSLGYLIATWEHRTFITAVMLGINPFDQFGVRAGKILTEKYLNQNGS